MTNTDWNNPRNWRGGETLTSTQLNKQVKTNLLRLYQRNYAVFTERYPAASYTTTSTSFVALGTEKWRLSLISIGNNIDINLMNVAFNTVSANYVYFDIRVDDDYYISSLTSTPLSDGLWRFRSIANTPVNHVWSHLLTGIPTGLHSYEVFWKVNAGTGVVWLNSVSQFMVEEYGLLTG